MKELDKTKEYYYSGSYVTIVGDVDGQPDLVVVDEGGDYGSMLVARRKELTPKEESWTFKKAQEHANEIRMITAKAQENLDEIADKIVDDALKKLASRIKFNVAFGEGGVHSAYALMLSDQLTKMIKEDGAKTIKAKEDPFV